MSPGGAVDLELSLVIITDVDASLLDRDTYSHQDALAALRAVDRHHVPLVLCSSKTRDELVALRRRLGIDHPFICENGGALHVPGGYFPFEIPGARRVDGYDVVAFGRPHAEVAALLRRAAEAAGATTRCFADMSVEEVAGDCGLTLPEAQLAKRREYDEPFRLLDGDPAIRARLERELRVGGVRLLFGGRYVHAVGNADKGVAASYLRRLYRKAFGPLTTVALGDGPNDVPLLRSADIPIIIRSANADATARVQDEVPWARVTSHVGPAGWRDAVLAILEQKIGESRRSMTLVDR